jgi:hypothetical protein
VACGGGRRDFFASCETADDCLSGLCSQGRCTKSCASDTDCGSGICVSKVCAAPAACSSAVSCQDQNPCTTDDCTAGVGCTHAAKVGPCDDGNACTVGDVCHAKTCSGVTTICDDGNPCTDDFCDPASGCRTSIGNDGKACAGGVCQGGACGPCQDWRGCNGLCLDPYRTGAGCEICLPPGTAPAFLPGPKCADGLVSILRDGQPQCVPDLAMWGVVDTPEPGTPGYPDLLPGRFVDNGDATLTDTVTCRTWQKDASPDGLSEADVQAWCDAAKTGGSDDWRLPSQAELESLVDAAAGKSGCAWDARFGGACGWYASATPSQYEKGRWSVQFDTGASQFLSSPGHVRCVR